MKTNFYPEGFSCIWRRGEMLVGMAPAWVYRTKPRRRKWLWRERDPMGLQFGIRVWRFYWNWRFIP